MKILNIENQMMNAFKGFFVFAFLLCLTVNVASAADEPKMPEPLKNLVSEGAQARYLGSENGLDGWITIKNGKEQYFYVTPDGSAFVMGLMFDKNGKMVTMQQVKSLQESSDGLTLDLFADTPAAEEESAPVAAGEGIGREFKTPSEQLYSDIEDSNWVALGNPDAPYIYMFVDPQCPYCKSFINDLRADYIENGLLQVRIIPVGFREETRAQAAFLLAVADPQKRWFAHLDGDEKALPVSGGAQQQGVQRNMAIMQSWKINVTPFTAYRGKDNQVKIIQGRGQDIPAILTDVTP